MCRGPTAYAGVLDRSLLHHRLQVADEAPQIDFDVVENTQLLRAVLPPPLLANLSEEKHRASSDSITHEIKTKALNVRTYFMSYVLALNVHI